MRFRRTAAAFAGVLAASLLFVALVPGAGRLVAQSTELFEHVTVLDPDARVIAVIADELRLLEFSAHWAVRVPVHVLSAARAVRAGRVAPVDAAGPPTSGGAYRLDLRSNIGDSQWWYRPSGRLRALTGPADGEWEVADPEAFNRLLGLPAR